MKTQIIEVDSIVGIVDRNHVLADDLGFKIRIGDSIFNVEEIIDNTHIKISVN